jgi:hypothetical protein
MGEMKEPNRYPSELCGRSSLLAPGYNESEFSREDGADESAGDYAGMQDGWEEYDEKP